VKKVLFAASALTLATLVSVGAQQGPPKAVSPKLPAQPLAPVAKAEEFQPMVTRYCVGCHNTRNPLPAGAPLVLDTINLADPAADPAMWERVVKKLGVGAMPPQGAPTPGPAELGRFRLALVAHLDAAAAKKRDPGTFVLHRLNRTEYANAVRDLLGVTIDAQDLLPSDGGDFGFDNVATALKTSPLITRFRICTPAVIVELKTATGPSGPMLNSSEPPSIETPSRER
jgi:mono/diheme cytochrome c family protein